MNTINKLLAVLMLGFALVLLTGCATYSKNESSAQPELVKSKIVGKSMKCKKNADGTIDQTSCVPSEKGAEVVSERLRVKMPSEECKVYDTVETQEAHNLCIERATNELNAKAAGTYQAPREQYTRQYVVQQPGLQSIVQPPGMFQGAPAGYGYGGYGGNGVGCFLLGWLNQSVCQGGYGNGYNVDAYSSDQYHFGVNVNR